jgi:hypothetical protein
MAQPFSLAACGTTLEHDSAAVHAVMCCRSCRGCSCQIRQRISPFLDCRSQVDLPGKVRLRLSVQPPVVVSNLVTLVDLATSVRRRITKRTPSALSLASGPISFSHSFVRGISMTPSMMAWLTCTPCGPNSRANDWLRALNAHLPVANDAMSAFAFTEAVAPVKMSDGGYCDFCSTPLRRRGSVA